MENPAVGGGALRFPMFVDLSGRRAVVIGGGAVAARRARTLLTFCAGVTVIAPEICRAAEESGAAIVRRPYAPGDCAGFGLVVAATDSREVNRAAWREARGLGIPVNVSDAPEECDFYFPAVVRQGSVVVGVTASGTDHALAAAVARRIRETPDILAPQKEVAP